MNDQDILKAAAVAGLVTIVLLTIVDAAFGATSPQGGDCQVAANDDKLELIQSDESAWCHEVVYWNSEYQCSGDLTQGLYSEDQSFRVEVQIEVNPFGAPGNEAERITVTPPPGYFAEPADTASVLDGEEVRILICPGVS